MVTKMLFFSLKIMASLTSQDKQDVSTSHVCNSTGNSNMTSVGSFLILNLNSGLLCGSAMLCCATHPLQPPSDKLGQ